MEPVAPSPKSPKLMVDATTTADGNKFRTLPQSLVHRIFSKLETIEVMRASAVSTDWRYLWTFMPYLEFDYEASWLNPLRTKFPLPLFYEKYKDIINWVLMAHDKSVSIRSFRLSCLNNGDDHSLYRWLHIVTQKNVRRLYLKVTSNSKKPFALPCFLLASVSLKVLDLNLQTSDLIIPCHSGFSRLKSLTLVKTRLLDQNLFQNLISSCPLLEDLILLGCVFHGFTILYISSENLRKFDYCDCDVCGAGTPPETKFAVKIACPNLVYFCLGGPLLQNLYWDKNPSFLKLVTINPMWPDDSLPNGELAYHLLKIIRGFCNSEFLRTNPRILELISPAVAKPGCFSTTFYNLKSLQLSTGLKSRYFQSIIYLLKCAPNLQRLSVSIELDHGCAWEIPLPDGDIACLRCHLKMVKFIGIGGNDNELELIKFFVKNGHVLEKMSIIWLENIDQKKANQKVLEFPRSSIYVTVSFSKLKPDQHGSEELETMATYEY